ncbi:MAG: hypothetical protein QOG96_5087, partial [Pseudonocardiales bacterium]|nr:hypothetical protein [Pseudonocardiales bacterium]
MNQDPARCARPAEKEPTVTQAITPDDI